jgi:glycogen debranching enzyme
LQRGQSLTLVASTEAGCFLDGEVAPDGRWAYEEALLEMDVKVGDWLVMPRSGKLVEAGRLWYNALQVIAALVL